jgi:hypothetical protein
MKKVINNISLAASKINRRHLQTIIILLTLSLLVLGAGAPAIDGGSGGW